MQKYLLLFIFLMIPLSQTQAQQTQTYCDTAEHEFVDFWLGNWDLTWEGGTGTNSITRTHGGCVINEDFKSANLIGMSSSIYDINTKTWRQIWMDNQNGYLNLKGHKEGDDFIFQTTPNPEEPEIQLRMVFSNIKQDSLNWSWQRTDSGGANWNDLWNISYTRAE